MKAEIANEQNAATAFSRQSVVFDDIYADNVIIQYKRERVRSHFMRYAPKNGSILELNSGTGEDAIFFAGQGFRVHATDISSGMIDRLQSKAGDYIKDKKITTELCSFTRLGELHNTGPFDTIFSNFGGLNCTSELATVLKSFAALLKPGGTVTLVIISRFCLWETLMLLKGNVEIATRRFFASKGRQAHIEGEYFKCWYYNPSFVINELIDEFELLDLEGLCTVVPPSYMEGFPKKYPRLYKKLTLIEDKLKNVSPFKYWGDYFIVSLKKR